MCDGVTGLSMETDPHPSPLRVLLQGLKYIVLVLQTPLLGLQSPIKSSDSPAQSHRKHVGHKVCQPVRDVLYHRRITDSEEDIFKL